MLIAAAIEAIEPNFIKREAVANRRLRSGGIYGIAVLKGGIDFLSRGVLRGRGIQVC
jgi:hypothetical protein